MNISEQDTSIRNRFAQGPAGGLIASSTHFSHDSGTTSSIVWIPSSADFVGKDQSVATLRAAGLEVERIEAFNNGLQASFLAKPKDMLILQNSPENQHLVETAVRKTAELWERQTGITSITPETGSVIFTDDMFAEMERRARQEQQSGLRIPQVIPQVEAVTDGLSVDFANFWNDKNKALPTLDAYGVSVAQTSVFEEYNPELVAKELTQVYEGKKVVLKIAGGAGGTGVYTNENRGFTHSQALDIVQGIHGPFQIQEFIKGQDFGVVAYIDHEGKIKIVSQHKQRIHHGEFFGAVVSMDVVTDTSLEEVSLQTFDAQYNHSKLMGVHTIGPSGVDIRKDAHGAAKVIETNMRETGAISVAYIRELLATNDSFRHRVEAELEERVERITTNTNFSIPPEVFSDPTFVDRTIQLAKRYNVLILTQGLNVHPLNSNTKMIFINDREQEGEDLGEAEAAFFDMVDTMYEQNTQKPGPNRHIYMR